MTSADCPIAAPEVQMLINAIAENKYRAMKNDRSSGSLAETLKIPADLNTSNSKTALKAAVSHTRRSRPEHNESVLPPTADVRVLSHEIRVRPVGDITGLA
jgi:hypothetical protein